MTARLLENKRAVVYGGAGNVGSAVAGAFARHGATVFLAGRRLAAVEAAAAAIRRTGGMAHAAEVDALDEPQVDRHLDAVAAAGGAPDVSFNAIGIPQRGIQGAPLVELPVEAFMLPVVTYARAHFITARAAARRMAGRRSGVILMHTPEPARLGVAGVGGMALAWAAMESLNRLLSAELARDGVRAVCLRTTGLPETSTIEVVYGLHAEALGIPVAQFRAMVESFTHTKRSTTLDELAGAAVFLASELGTGMTGAVVNLTGGLIVD